MGVQWQGSGPRHRAQSSAGARRRDGGNGNGSRSGSALSVSIIAGMAGRGAPCIRRFVGRSRLSACVQVLSPPFSPILLGFALHGRCIRRSRGTRLGLIRCVGQALATETIAECIRGGGICEAESNIELLGLVSTPTAADRDASFLVERIKL